MNLLSWKCVLRLEESMVSDILNRKKGYLIVANLSIFVFYEGEKIKASELTQVLDKCEEWMWDHPDASLEELENQVRPHSSSHSNSNNNARKSCPINCIFLRMRA